MMKHQQISQQSSSQPVQKKKQAGKSVVQRKRRWDYSESMPISVPSLGDELPSDLRERLESRSGFDLSDVQVHYNSQQPSQLGADAYTEGKDIFVAPGQERHLGHEAWHVIQQAQGRVQPTGTEAGVETNESPALETEADMEGSLSAGLGAEATMPLPVMPGVAQFKRSDKANPLLANERDLLADVQSILTKGRRENLDDHLIDTTYGNLTDNLLLDVNMLFEENLQRNIEGNSQFTELVKGAVDLIHKQLTFDSLSTKDKDMLLRDNTEEDTPKRKRKANLYKSLQDSVYSGKSRDDIKSALKTAGWRVKDNPTATAQAKLLKMLYTQYPYFGGSTEYKEGKEDSFEYWIYHMSSLTRDPARQYLNPQDPLSKLPKPMMDYRTHTGGLLPAYNQRNLGTGVAEAEWEELPINLRIEMYNRFTFPSLQNTYGNPKYSKKKMHSLVGPSEKLFSESFDAFNVGFQSTWNRLTEDQKKALYGDLLRVPWSDVHQEHDPHSPENVVGVRGNILETPENAAKRYSKDLGKVPETILSQIHHDKEPHVPGQNVDNLTEDFTAKHQKWFNAAKEHHKPIIGGISGHTLGYLNLYEAALDSMKSEDQGTKETRGDKGALPTMEELRACMLGALVGDKRHHSYDEVMTASVGMPTHNDIIGGDGDTLQYTNPGGYGDVLKSYNSRIKNAATASLEETKKSINDPESNTVLSKIISDSRMLQDGDKIIADLKMQLDSYFVNPEEAKSQITNILNSKFKV